MTKVIKDIIVKGRRRVTFEMPTDVHITAIFVEQGSYWKMGGQVDEVFASHVLQEAHEVIWDSIEQKWMEV